MMRTFKCIIICSVFFFSSNNVYDDDEKECYVTLGDGMGCGENKKIQQIYNKM